MMNFETYKRLLSKLHSYSRGDSEESDTQQLIMGSTIPSKVSCN